MPPNQQRERGLFLADSKCGEQFAIVAWVGRWRREMT
jgi:hypothetical protein